MDVRTAIKELLAGALYQSPPADRARDLLPLFRACLAAAAERHAGYRHYVSNWPIPMEQATRTSDLPYLPVSLFKNRELISLLAPGVRHRVVVSSATSTQTPSRIVVDAGTARSMSLGAMSIFRDFIGSQRRPYFIIDNAQATEMTAELSARSAAIRSLMPLATQWHMCLNGEMRLDVNSLRQLVGEYRDQPLLIYGFTYILWFHFAKELQSRGIRLDLPQAVVLHSGGWKRLVADSVDKTAFNNAIADVVGCPPSRVIDFYGMVENIGVVYPDCERGNKHVPSFADVTIRSPLTLQPVNEGETGIIQVGSLLPESFPGHLLLTEDLGTVVSHDGCPCGRRGLAFRLEGRIPRAELRGCGDVLAKKLAA